MITKKLQRLFHGLASLRSYDVDDAIKTGEDILVICDNEQMLIPNDKLKKGKWNKIIYKSKHGRKSYCLVDYKFLPIKNPTLF